MKKQSADARVKNFLEVALGMSGEEAIKESKRCIQCKQPQCIAGCPVSIDIPRFIKFLAEEKYDEIGAQTVNK